MPFHNREAQVQVARDTKSINVIYALLELSLEIIDNEILTTGCYSMDSLLLSFDTNTTK